MAVEPADGVRPRRVVVEVDVPDHRGEVAWAGAGDWGCIGRASAQRAENTDTAECGDAERKTHGRSDVLSHSVLDLHGFRGVRATQHKYCLCAGGKRYTAKQIGLFVSHA